MKNLECTNENTVVLAVFVTGFYLVSGLYGEYSVEGLLVFDTDCIAWGIWSEDPVVDVLWDYSIIVCQNAAINKTVIFFENGVKSGIGIRDFCCDCDAGESVTLVRFIYSVLNVFLSI